jgi:hypothetical protein
MSKKRANTRTKNVANGNKLYIYRLLGPENIAFAQVSLYRTQRWEGIGRELWTTGSGKITAHPPPIPPNRLWAAGGCGSTTACGAGPSDAWPSKKLCLLGSSESVLAEDPAPPLAPGPGKSPSVAVFGFPFLFLVFIGTPHSSSGTVTPFGACCTLTSCSTSLPCDSVLGATYGYSVSPTTRVSSTARTYQIPTAHWPVALDGCCPRGLYIVSTSRS